MAKVLLKIKGEDQHFVVSRLKVKQLKDAMKKIKHVINLVRQNERLAGVLNYFATMERPEDGNEAKAIELNKEFLAKIIESFDFLLEEFPEEAVELISVLSGIDVDVLDEQEIDTLFDVFDAIVTENDLLMLWNRVKQTFSAAKSKWQVMRAK
jgi:hypothetical protein